MVQSHSWEANRFAASQEIPLISRKPKVHYRTHKHTKVYKIPSSGSRVVPCERADAKTYIYLLTYVLTYLLNYLLTSIL